jgi:hypothetical protein
MGQKQVSFTERCPLFRGEIPTLLAWDRNKCPLQRDVLYSEVKYLHYSISMGQSVIYRERCPFQRGVFYGTEKVSFTGVLYSEVKTGETGVLLRCPLFRGKIQVSFIQRY